MGNSELKPCLRCGGKAKLLGVGTSVIRRTYAVECDSCHYLTKWSESIAEVIKLWNTRHAERSKLVPLDEETGEK